MLIRLIEKEELMLLLRIQPYTTLCDFLPSEGRYIAVFDDFGTVRETEPPDFLLGRLLLRRGLLLTSEKGIVGVSRYEMSAAGNHFYGSRAISGGKLVSSLRPLLEEAIQCV